MDSFNVLKYTTMTQLTTSVIRKRILIVEDDADECSLMREHLDGHFEIAGFAPNYDGLLRLLQPGQLPQLILVNLSLPRKNGLEILHELKHNKLYQEIPVILISVSFSEYTINKAMEMGASACIEKPMVFSDYHRFSAAIYDLIQGAVI
ncbi:response regulator [Filimonas effusa]|uniref:Response regulator n=2 Tax=Filimonas effusa TaxID=2508721 RepID=A0A4V1MAI1_9BACT|nr:response regulator [Filimonas effusa]